MACNWLMMRSFYCPDLVRIGSNADFLSRFQKVIFKRDKSRIAEGENSATTENNTWARVDMEFLFECLTRYHVQVKYEKRNSISKSNHVYFVYYINILMTTFLAIFRRFLPLSVDFPKIFQRPDESLPTFSNIFRRLPKTTEEDPKMFRSYTNKFKRG